LDTSIPEALRQLVNHARRIFVLTGAGISAESGIPTYRGGGGHWRKFNPMELASAEGFARNPKLCWEWYLERRAEIRQAQPNPGHLALARLERQAAEMLIATQNIDELHQRAGSRNVVEIHGSIWRTRCTRTGREYREGEVQIEGGPIPPLTPEGDLLRPAVVWFGEMLPLRPLEQIAEFLAVPPDLALVIGTSAAFGYIVEWALRAKRMGATLVEINPDSTELSALADFQLRQPAGQALPSMIHE
jgi:NAD-dependent deacetylase